MPDPTVRVQNYGSEPFSGRYDGVTYTVPAGGDLFLPWPAACLWLGDPRKKDLSPTRRERVEEIDRVMVKNGVHDNNLDTLLDQRPTLKVFTTEGAEIPMIVDDPHAPPSDPFGDTPDAQTLEERTHKLEQVLAQIAASTEGSALAEQLASMGIGDTTGPGSVTTAKKAPARKRAGAPPVDAPQKPKASG